jgi:hypothetical protein
MSKTILTAPENRKINGRSVKIAPMVGRTAVPSIRHRVCERCHGGITRTGPLHDCCQCTWRDERKRREKANVPFHFAFTLRDLGERLNAA